jgi:hypothetical protein
MVLATRGRLERLLGPYRDMVVFDPACDDFVALIQAWMEETAGVFDVTHDQSKPLARGENVIRAYMTPALPRMYGYGDRKKELPLRIASLQFGDSKQHPALQLADLIAGAAVDWCMVNSGQRPRTEYHDSLKGTHLPELCAGTLLPTDPAVRPASPPGEPIPGEKNLVDGNVEFLHEIGFFKT